MKSWIVGFWSRIFGALSWVSLFRLLRALIKPLGTAGGVEVWVTSNVVLAFLAAWASTTVIPRWLSWAIVIYGAIRVFEITVYQVNVLLFDKLRAHDRGEEYALEGYTRLVLLLLLNYVEIILWFAAAYGVLVPQVGGVARTLPVLLTESFATFTGYGASHVVAGSTLALGVIWAEGAAGLFMSIVVLARFISLLPVPRSKTKAEWNEDD